MSAPSGRVLLDTLQCTSCHSAGNDVAFPLSAPRRAPRLTQAGSRLTPQFLRAYLSDPHAVKPGTPMPDLLHDRPEAARIVDELVHFLVSLEAGEQPPLVGLNPYKMSEGQRLYHQVGCAACHAPFQAPGDGNGAAPGILARSSIPLGPLASKYTVPALAALLRNPLDHRPSGRMPSLNLTEGEAHSIAMYLLRDQVGSQSGRPPKKIQGLFYEYFEGGMNSATQLEKMQPAASGTVGNFSLEPRRRKDNIGFRYTGYITVPRDGDYTFHASSDDGSLLHVGDRLVVNNDGVHATREKSGSITLKAGDHPIMVLWFNGGGELTLRISYEGPDLPKQAVPDGALSHLGQAMIPLHQEVLKPDPAKVRRGREQFRQLGCASCHEAGVPPMDAPLPGLLSLGGKTEAGCLAEVPAAGVPRYNLTREQRQALQELLADPAPLRREPSAEEVIQHSLLANNCYACHERGRLGGPTPARAAYFTMTTQDDLGDEGRIPPHLNGVGGKLRPKWLETVLLHQGAVRPYMATRMPQFGPANVAPLVAAFSKADLRTPPTRYPERPIGDAKYGRVMVGIKGFSCISCHSFGGYRSLGIQAMDLTEMTRRLRQDWFHRYLVDPQSLRPGTRMPSFWPEGESLRADLLDGDTHRQIQAIWAYLSLGEKAGIPHGLIQGKMELGSSSEALIYRAFINKSGTRGIGVAYPERANLTFDANELRLSLIWQGPFIDAAKHRIGRGAGFEGPLGYNVVELPAGPSFARLEHPDAPWPAQPEEAAGHQMRGYRLDPLRRPVFLYDIGSVRIEDYPVAVAGDLEAFIRRAFTLESDDPPSGLWFLAWRGDLIEPRGERTFLLDERIQMTFEMPAGLQPLIRRSAGKAELLIPVDFQAGQASFLQEIIW